MSYPTHVFCFFCSTVCDFYIYWCCKWEKVATNFKDGSKNTSNIKLYDEGLTPTKDGGTCLRRLSMFRKEVH